MREATRARVCAAVEPIETLVHIELGGGGEHSLLSLSGGSEESSHYSAARTRLSRASSRAAPSPPETRAAAVARSTWRQWLFGFAEEDAVSICHTEEEFYDTAEYFYFESGAEGITEVGGAHARPFGSSLFRFDAAPSPRLSTLCPRLDFGSLTTTRRRGCCKRAAVWWSDSQGWWEACMIRRNSTELQRAGVLPYPRTARHASSRPAFLVSSLSSAEWR